MITATIFRLHEERRGSCSVLYVQWLALYRHTVPRPAMTLDPSAVPQVLYLARWHMLADPSIVNLCVTDCDGNRWQWDREPGE